MELVGIVKNYDWGKLGLKSIVAHLAQANEVDFCVESDLPYAELWMGVHPSGPSLVRSTGEDLSTKIDPLPYLFKVLSIRRALSIQVHPNKQQAEILHKEQPDLYKDPNHKPELAIALTPFLALCGFRPHNEISNFCNELPPLMEIVGETNLENLLTKVKDDDDESYYLRKCYEPLMRADDKVVAQCINDIAENYKEVLQNHKIYDVFTTINADFPADVGVLSLFFLNLLRLQPGEAIFLGANEIHAYLSGDCIECMACSDNVIRAGLTPKFKDVDRLLESLKYKSTAACKKIYAPFNIDEKVKIFVPPVDDFCVAHIVLRKQCDPSPEYTMQMPQTGGIMLTLGGARLLNMKIGKEETELLIERGSIVYIPPEAAPEISFKTTNCPDLDDEEFVSYLAMYNSYRKP